MSPKRKKSQSVSTGEIRVVGNVSVGSNRMAGDPSTDAPPPERTSKTVKMFLEIRSQVDKRPEDQEIDKDELKDILERIEQEIKKGDSAKPAKLERWLGYLSRMTPDIFDVTATLILEPTFHLRRFVRTIIQKIRESN